MPRIPFARVLLLVGAVAQTGCGGAGDNPEMTEEQADSLVPNMVTGTTGAPGPGTAGTPGTPGAPDPDTMDATRDSSPRE